MLRRYFFSVRILFTLLALGIANATARAEFSVEIDLQEQRAYLLRKGYVVLESPIASGRPEYPTPTGRFKVTQKEMAHHSSTYGKIVDDRGRTLVADADIDMPVPPGGRFVPAPMHFFMRFNGAIGMHAGVLPGYAASHGCVRMPKEKAALFYKVVQIGTPVTVFGSATDPRHPGHDEWRWSVPFYPHSFTERNRRRDSPFRGW